MNVRQKLKRVLSDMKRRCYNKNCAAYQHYGLRNIGICNEWLNNTNSFIDWAMQNGYKSGLSIDRIDNDASYSPENCRWVSQNTQAANKRPSRPSNKQYIGVFKRGNSWRARVIVDGVYVFYKQFKNIHQAARERDAFILNNKLPHILNFKYFN